MFACPTCGKATISFWGKVGASSTMPTSCRECMALATLPDDVGWVSSALLDVLLWGSIVLAIWLRTAYALLAFPALAAGWGFYVGRFVRLLPITREQVAATRYSAFRHIVLGACVVFAAYLMFGARQ